MTLVVLRLLFGFHLVTAVLGTCSDCAYRGCHRVDDSKLNVHLIAHTHDDAGWLKTADQYYYGDRQSEAEGGVQYIIDSVLGELDADKDRRFILVETLFLWRWWNERSVHVREKMKRFLDEGRLQLIGGGWVMSDEATPHYSMLIDQMSLGLRMLKEMFGDCGMPRIAWQIDPFGHSSEVGKEFIDMGFDAVFFGRINQDDYLTRLDTRTMEMIWKPNANEEDSIFTGVLRNLYQPPDGFCFDVSCHDEPIIDNPRLHGYNVQRRVSRFIDYARDWASSYQTNHVMMTMGGDFHYMVASSWFVNLDKIIKYANAKYSDINVIYSTPACYLKALNKANKTWPLKEDEDFFPYSSYEKRYWTGYYSSRPTLKFYIARVNNLLQVIKKMGVYSSTWNQYDEFEMERAVALAQHHDAISGTQRQHVASDYALYLNEAVLKSENMMAKAYRSWGEPESKQMHCMERNISECLISERSRRFILYVFNPLSSSTNFTIRLPFGQNTIEAYEAPGVPVSGDVLPIPTSVLNLPGRHSTATHEYIFQATDLPPMGYKTYHVHQVNGEVISENHNDSFTMEPSPSPSTEVTLGFDDGALIVLNIHSGLIQYVILDRATWYLEQNFGYYESAQRWHSSGAYTFSPSFKGLIELKIASHQIHRANNVIEIHQTFEPWITQVIRLYKGRRTIEFEWLIGPIPIGDHVSKEIITVYKTHLTTNGVFYTDSNGRRFIKRRKNHRGKSKTSATGVESNYYPVTTAAMIKDSRATVTVLTDRAQGSTSWTDGQLEFMLHRRILTDDAKGVTEPLDEKAFGTGLVVRGKHIVHFTENINAAYQHRLKSLEISQGPWLSMSPTSNSLSQWEPKEVSFIREPLPENIHILTLQRLSRGVVLLRLEHIFEPGEDLQYSEPVEVSITNIFPKGTVIKSIREVTLDGNSGRECNREKMVWTYGHQHNRTKLDRPPKVYTPSVILKPMEIRTFLIAVSM